MNLHILGILAIVIVTCRANVVRQRNYRNSNRRVGSFSNREPVRHNDDARISAESEVGRSDSDINNLQSSETQASKEALTFTQVPNANIEEAENPTALEVISIDATTPKEEIKEIDPKSLHEVQKVINEVQHAHDANEESNVQTKTITKVNGLGSTNVDGVAQVKPKKNEGIFVNDNIQILTTTPMNATQFGGGFHMSGGVSPGAVTTYSGGTLHNTPGMENTGTSDRFSSLSFYPYTGKMGSGIISGATVSGANGRIVQADSIGPTGPVKIGVTHSTYNPEDAMGYVGPLIQKNNNGVGVYGGISMSSSLLPQGKTLVQTYNYGPNYGYYKGNSQRTSIGKLNPTHVSIIADPPNGGLYPGGVSQATTAVHTGAGAISMAHPNANTATQYSGASHSVVGRNSDVQFSGLHYNGAKPNSEGGTRSSFYINRHDSEPEYAGGAIAAGQRNSETLINPLAESRFGTPIPSFWDVPPTGFRSPRTYLRLKMN